METDQNRVIVAEGAGDSHGLGAPLDAASRESAERALDDIRLFIQSHES